MKGNAYTDMAARLAVGALQPNGQVIPEATFDAQHVADAILHIANLPTTVSVLEMTIMYASWCSSLSEVSDSTIFRATGMPYVGRG